MAGFVDRDKGGKKSKILPSIGDYLKKLSSLGMEYDDMIIKNSRSIGRKEDMFGWKMDPNNLNGGDADDYGMFASLAMMDTNLRKNVSVFDKTYVARRDELRNYAKQDDIEEVLDTLSDECIVLDDNNYFCEPIAFEDATMDVDLNKKIRESIDESFKKIYKYWGFNDDIAAWSLFKRFLVEGFLAFEIVYSEDQKSIIGFTDIDPVTLTPVLKDKKKAWVQFKGNPTKERLLWDSQVIYISYSHADVPGRISYVERLIRSFNLLRLMEHSRIIWAVVNSSFKTKFIIPVGGKSKARQKQSLASLMQNYREIVDFSIDSGELKVNGKPMMPFNKEYWLPETESGSPSIESFGNDGPDLSDTEALKYFRMKFLRITKIPLSRFDADNPATWALSADGYQRDEIKFSKFVRRLRSIFKELIVKPLWVQMCIEYPELSEDDLFRSKLGIKFNKENYFDEMKEIEVFQKRLDFVQGMKDGLVDTDADGNEVKFFSSEFLITRFMKFSADDLKMNEKLKAKDRKAMQKPESSEEDSSDASNII